MGGMSAAEGEAELQAAALEGLYRDEFGGFVSLARWIVGDRRLAEELVNDTFVRLLERPPTLDDVANLRAYVRTAIVNRSRSRVRRLVLERRHAASASQRADDPPEPEEVALVRAAIAALPRRQREVVVLRFHADLSVAAIAATLAIGEGSVKTHLHRAMRALERHIEAVDPDRTATEAVGGPLRTEQS